MDELKANGVLKLNLEGGEVSLTEEDLLIDMTQKEGYETQADNYVTVVIDTNLTDELIEEGYAAEIISKIQTMRKEADFEVMDRIRVAVSGNEKLAAVVEKNKAAIADKVLAENIATEGSFGVSRAWNINGEDCTISVERI